MTVSAPFVARPMRQVGISLTDTVLDRVDTLRILDGMPSRSAALAELVEVALALREDPKGFALALIEELEQIAGIEPAGDPVSDTTPAWSGTVNLKEPTGC